MPRRLLVSLVLVLAAACAGPAALSTNDEQDLLLGLCDAIMTDQTATSEVAFFVLAHAPLHTLASQLTDRDEVTLAADLLVAKQRVEASYDQQVPSGILHDNLETLRSATNDGLAALDLPTIDCEGTPR